MISFLLVSHSKKITDGLKEMIDEMSLNKDNITTFSIGGTKDGRLGTDPIAIYEAIEMRKMDDAILIFTDLGSAVLSSEIAVDMIDDELKQKVHIVDCALVEGAFIAAVQINGVDCLEQVLNELKTI